MFSDSEIAVSTQSQDISSRGLWQYCAADDRGSVAPQTSESRVVALFCLVFSTRKKNNDSLFPS